MSEEQPKLEDILDSVFNEISGKKRWALVRRPVEDYEAKAPELVALLNMGFEPFSIQDGWIWLRTSS